MMDEAGAIRPPRYRRLAAEPLSSLEYASLALAGTLRVHLKRGDGHPVLVLPGFMGSDQSTEQLRRILKRHGHDVHGWRQGRNTGAHPAVVRNMRRRLLALYGGSGRRVSVVGWSLGGIFARELAREYPDLVRVVVTLGTPFRFRTGDRGHVSSLYDRLGPRADPFLDSAVREEERPPLPVPATSIYTRTDGIVRWHACIDSAGPLRENIEVVATHNGLGHNVAAAVVIADRLACPEGEWIPFRPPPRLRRLYPRAESWDPAANSRR